MKHVLFTAVLCLFVQAGPARSAESTKPNILFFFADDQRADTIAALGNPVIRTPSLDRLAHRGIAFNRAYKISAKAVATMRVNYL